MQLHQRYAADPLGRATTLLPAPKTSAPLTALHATQYCVRTLFPHYYRDISPHVFRARAVMRGYQDIYPFKS